MNLTNVALNQHRVSYMDLNCFALTCITLYRYGPTQYGHHMLQIYMDFFILTNITLNQNTLLYLDVIYIYYKRTRITLHRLELSLHGHSLFYVDIDNLCMNTHFLKSTRIALRWHELLQLGTHYLNTEYALLVHVLLYIDTDKRLHRHCFKPTWSFYIDIDCFRWTLIA